MSTQKQCKYLGLLVLALGCAYPLARAQDGASPENGNIVQAVSIPSDKRNPSFGEVGIVKEVLVKPGDHVKQGQVLAREDSDLEKMEYDAMKIEAESTAEIDAAIADRDSKKLQADNLQQAKDNGAANDSELQEAKLAYVTAVIKIRYEQEQHQQKLADLAKQARKIEKMELDSPFDGIVEKINIQPGEVVDPAKPDGALTVVANQPLWIDMHLPSAQAAKLKLGDTLQAAYVNDPGNWIAAKVIYMDPEVDASSDTQTVRLELPNTENRPAGLLLSIRLDSGRSS